MSKQAKPTPGPWQAGRPDTRTTSTVTGKWVYDSADRYIAIAACEDGMAQEELMANARLIAAAPQLLAACEAVMDWYDRDGSVGGAVDPMEQLSAAIKAARGMT